MTHELTGALPPGSNHTQSLRRATCRLGVIYWLAVFVSSSLLWAIVGTDPIESALGKTVHYSLSAIITFTIASVLFHLRNWSLAWKSAFCFAMALAAAPIYSFLDFGIYAVCVYPQPVSFDWKDFGYDLIYATSLFFGWSCLYVALVYSFEIRDRERRLAAAREEALASQMRALRYQVNPHFLFNTLNSMAALIEEGAADRARDMMLTLSTFLRTTLTLDPMHDVRLKDEIALQSGYLEIERNRFSDRMRISIDIAPDVQNALVPSLILQPLVENAVKHGIGRKTGEVEILIRASADAERLTVVVENDIQKDDGPTPAGPAIAGLGIGLSNVAERIMARFPEAASCVAQRIAPQRFRTTLTMPLRLA
jgi:two-component sensor histidine kinase